MPDDRPESPDLREEFLVCGAAGYPDPHRPHPNTREEAQRFADEHRRLPKYDPVVKHRLATAWHSLDVALSTPAGPSPEPAVSLPTIDFIDHARACGGLTPGQASAAPSPREEAVGAPDERDVSLVARALDGVCDSTGRPMILRERQDLARGALFAVTLSAARPSSPAPEETRTEDRDGHLVEKATVALHEGGIHPTSGKNIVQIVLSALSGDLVPREEHEADDDYVPTFERVTDEDVRSLNRLLSLKVVEGPSIAFEEDDEDDGSAVISNLRSQADALAEALEAMLGRYDARYPKGQSVSLPGPAYYADAEAARSALASYRSSSSTEEKVHPNNEDV